MGRVILGFDEETFWNMTPRILYELINLHKQINVEMTGKKKAKTFIDQIL